MEAAKDDGLGKIVGGGGNECPSTAAFASNSN